MASIDVAPVIGAVLPLVLSAATAAIGVSVPYGAVLLKRWLHISLTTQQLAAISAAADKGAELAYGFLVANDTHYGVVPMRNAALAGGVNHVLASVPEAIAAMGFTPEQVHNMVDARLGGLLAKDPAVTVAPPANVPPKPPIAAPADKPAS